MPKLYGTSIHDKHQVKDIPVFTVQFKNRYGRPTCVTYRRRIDAETLKTRLENYPDRGPVTIKEELQTQWFITTMTGHYQTVNE